jgi:glycosyltransferase 2 family protein
VTAGTTAADGRNGGGTGRIVRALAGIGISVIALWVVVGTVDLAAAGDALARADLRWVALLAVFIGLDVVLRAVRWRMLLAPVARVPFRAALTALLVGYLANNILPARLGELIRCHVLGDRTGVSRSTILGTVVVERIVDTAVVVAIAAFAILVLSVRGVVAAAIGVGVAITAVLVIGVLLAMVAHRLPFAERAAARLAARPELARILSRLREGLAVAGRPQTMLQSIGLSVAGWSCSVLGFAAAAQAVGIEPTIGQAALLAAGTNLATAIPAGPGYIGTFELAAVTIATSVGLPEGPALAFALIVHVATIVLTSLGGVVAVVAGSVRPGSALPPGPRPGP